MAATEGWGFSDYSLEEAGEPKSTRLLDAIVLYSAASPQSIRVCIHIVWSGPDTQGGPRIQEVKGLLTSLVTGTVP